MDAALMSSGLTCLSNCESIRLAEQFHVVEAESLLQRHGSNAKSRYRIYTGDGEEIFYGVQQVGRESWLQSCLPDCAPWGIDIYPTENREVATVGETSGFALRRPFALTCCCCNRPVVDVTDIETGMRLGAIEDPFACCDMSFEIKDTEKHTILRAGGKRCQWGLCCPYPCGPCSRVELKVAQPGSTIVGDLDKRLPTCWNFLFRKEAEAHYNVNFGNIEAPDHKALMMALAILIDYKFFHMVNTFDSIEWVAHE
jgi:hypothetical protein